jgi:hypothetical protein
MRKLWSVVLGCLLVIGFSSLALAQENKTMTGKETMKAGMMEKGMMDKGMMEKCMKEKGEKCCDKEKMEHKEMMGMHQMMMSKSMVATPDGGVIVMVGHKLQKYDKDLVLQKEVDLKMDKEEMKEKGAQQAPSASGHEAHH